jgi:predicted RNA-binding Zn ribbon-like protein
MELLETGRGGPMFRWLGEAPAVDLANTVLVVKPGDARDLLASPADLDLWLRHERERLGRIEPGRLGDLKALRDAVRRLFTAVAEQRRLPAGDVRLVNDASAAAALHPRLRVGRGGVPRRLEQSSGDPGTELLARIARSAIDLLTGPERERLRICAAPNCGMFFVANPSKPGQRWCCRACGNRARVAAHYRRHA